MAKITRQNHKIFGGTGSSDNFAKFGSLVALDPIKTKDIATIQALPAWDEGFQSSIYGDNKNLLLEDLNSFAFEHSRQIAYLFQAGVPEWQEDTTYFKGSIVQRTTGGGDATGEMYVSAIDNNVGNTVPVQTNDANWTYLNPATLPAGAMLDFTGFIAPAGFLLGDGTAYSRTTYAALFANTTVTRAGNLSLGNPAITGLPTTSSLQPGFYISGVGIPSGAQILTVDSGTQVTMNIGASSTQTPSAVTFGCNPLGDGSTTFNVADSRRRTTVGSGGSGTAVLKSAPGSTGGEETHTLTTAEMPAHTHTGYNTPNGTTGQTGVGSHLMEAGNTGSTGGGAAHNIIQPSLVVMKIIKY